MSRRAAKISTACRASAPWTRPFAFALGLGEAPPCIRQRVVAVMGGLAQVPPAWVWAPHRGGRGGGWGYSSKSTLGVIFELVTVRRASAQAIPCPIGVMTRKECEAQQLRSDSPGPISKG
jgi:hypothetical protein